MKTLNYVSLENIDPQLLLPILNSEVNRTHLMAHDPFTAESLAAWIENKCLVDKQPGCRVRAIQNNNSVLGWCGIQQEAERYEIAIVVDKQYWGVGKQIFKDMMDWAKELNHDTVFIYFLHTRPQYAFLRKRAKQVINFLIKFVSIEKAPKKILKK